MVTLCIHDIDILYVGCFISMYINDIENVACVSILGQISPHTEACILLALTHSLQVVAVHECLFGAQTL